MMLIWKKNVKFLMKCSINLCSPGGGGDRKNDRPCFKTIVQNVMLRPEFLLCFTAQTCFRKHAQNLILQLI